MPDILPGALRWPDRSWCECQAFLVGPRAQASLCYINSQKDRLFCIDRATWETKLRSTAAERRSNSTGQARRCRALLGSHGRDSLQGRPPNGEDATDDDRRTTGRETRRASSTKQGRKNAGMIFGAKLDGLATRNTAGSGRDVRETWHYEPLRAHGRGRCRTLMTSEKTTVLCL